MLAIARLDSGDVGRRSRARGQLGKQLIAKYALDAGKDPQGYAIGIKELWEIDPAKHQAGLVVHTAGWPMDTETYGGGFLYHLEDNRVTLGLVVGLTVTDGETLGVAVGRFAGSTNCSTAWPLSAAFMNAVQIRAG